MKQTLTQLHSLFIEDCRYSGKLRPETVRGYEAVFTLFTKLMEEINYPSELDRGVMTDFFKKLEKRERIVGKDTAKQGVKSSTVATYRNKLNKFSKWMIANKYLQGNPFEGIPYPEVSYSDRKYLPKSDVERILTAIEYNINWDSTFVKSRNKAMFITLLCCGLRKGELLGLKVLDVDLNRLELRVRGETSKSKRDRYIPLNLLVETALREYLEERRRKGIKSEYIWVSSTADKKLTMSGFKHLNRKVSEVSGVTFHPHQFRHTFAVNMLNSGADIYKVQKLLGHIDIRMTTVYLRGMPPSTMQRDVERLTLNSLL